MSTEITVTDVRPEAADEFQKVFVDQGIPILDQAGMTGVGLHRSLSNPARFVLSGEWESPDARVEFTKSPLFADFLALLGGYAAGPPSIDDYDRVYPAR
jgi:quinol monooxygenase YgiN